MLKPDGLRKSRLYPIAFDPLFLIIATGDVITSDPITYKWWSGGVVSFYVVLTSVFFFEDHIRKKVLDSVFLPSIVFDVFSCVSSISLIQ